LRAVVVWVAALISHVRSNVAIEAPAYGITPAIPARRAGAGVPPNISETFFYTGVSDVILGVTISDWSSLGGE
jgi:hypothetical protein